MYKINRILATDVATAFCQLDVPRRASTVIVKIQNVRLVPHKKMWMLVKANN